LDIFKIEAKKLTIDWGKSSAIKRRDHQAWISVGDNGIGFEIDQILARRGRTGV